MSIESSTPWDCLVIGGGPAGLTAAVYLGRFRRRVLLVDADRSRAAMIPATHNFPGFPEGISGRDLLARLRAQAERYGAVLRTGTVDSLAATEDGFVAGIGDERIAAARVILTAGVEDRDTGIPDVRTATLEGSVRWCPVCDGYEIIDQDVALLASAGQGPAHALFLRTYTRELTLFEVPPGAGFSERQREELARADIRVVSEPLGDVLPLPEGGVLVRLASGREYRFDTLYPMLGQEPRSQLALAMGAQCDDAGDLVVDGHQQTSVPGLYAAGDVVNALNQMTVGIAHAASAATAVHNNLGHNAR